MKSPVTRREAEIIPLNPRAYSDPEIVAGVLGGDPFAGKALVDRFTPIIDGRVWRLMGSDSEHRDIVQQVFQQVVHTLSQLDDPQALEAWVGQVTVNVVLKELRRRRYRRLVGFATEFVEETPDTRSIERRLEVLRGLAILKKMRPEDRVAFVLRFIEGVTLEEMAAAMGCSLATAKRRIRRARERFLKKAERDAFLAPLVGKERR
jgi:RNA polymerase sigma-70 factor (ECF subfamily)